MVPLSFCLFSNFGCSISNQTILRSQQLSVCRLAVIKSLSVHRYIVVVVVVVSVFVCLFLFSGLFGL